MKISKDAVPEIIHYGILLLYNFDNSKPLNKEDDKITFINQNFDNSKLCGYYIMPKYEMNFKEYLKLLKGTKKIEQIIEVCY